VLIEEPTIAAIVVSEQKMVAWVEKPRIMLGRVPESIEVLRPLRNGVIADYEVAEYMLHDVLVKVHGQFRIFSSQVMITVPDGVTSVERRAVHEAVLQAGSRDAYLIQQPLAAAIGVDLPIGTPSGNMILCLGGGTTQAAVLAMYGIVVAKLYVLGVCSLMRRLSVMCVKNMGLIIGQQTAEQVKLKIGAAVSQDEEKSVEIQGQDQVTGLPRPVTLTTGEIIDAIEEPLHLMVETARRVLEKTPPELVSDIIDRGVAIAAVVPLLRGVDRSL